MNIQERCIETICNNNRMNFCQLPQMKTFLKENFSVKCSKLNKPEVIEMLQERLNADTLPMYSHLDKFGLTRQDAAAILGCTVDRVDKLRKEGRITESGKVYSMNSYHDIPVLKVEDIIALHDDKSSMDLIKIKRPAHNTIELTDSNIAEALYIINKSAKKSRDTKLKAYDNGKHGVCHSAKTRSLKLYHLKDAVIEKMINEGRATYIGITRQEINCVCYYFLKTYSIDNYLFHVPDERRVVDVQEIKGNISGVISAEATRPTKMKFSEAVLLLKDYLGEGYEEYTPERRVWYY